MMDKNEFLRRRKSGIGGSDVGKIFGVSKFGTPYDVWKSKVSDEVEEEHNDVLELAAYLEEFTAQKFAAETGRKVRRRSSELISMQYPCLHGNIDREILLDERGLGILECKALSTYNFRKVEMYGLPEDYLFQIQHYLLSGNGLYKFAEFAILNRDSGKLLHFEIQPDADVQQMIGVRCQAFWDAHVATGIPPVLGDIAPKVELPKVEGTVEDFHGDSALNTLIAQYNETIPMLAEVNDMLDCIKGKIAEHLADHEAVECEGARIYYKASSRTTFDSVRFKKEHSDLYQQYVKTKVGERCLRIYHTGGAA